MLAFSYTLSELSIIVRWVSITVSKYLYSVTELMVWPSYTTCNDLPCIFNRCTEQNNITSVLPLFKLINSSFLRG